jgi:hypothetical protein
MRKDLSRLIDELKKEYGLSDVEIEINQRPQVKLLETSHGAVFLDSSTGKNKWHIEVVGQPEIYMATHEFLHIVLEETGRYLEPKRSNKNHQAYLTGLKYLIDDYLIETEMKRRYKGKGREIFVERRLKDYPVLRMCSSPIDTMMDLLCIRAICTNVYPSLSGNSTATILRDAITSTRFDEVTEICKGYSFLSTSPTDYQGFVQRVHAGLTESSLHFCKGNRIRFQNIRELTAFLKSVKELTNYF